MDMLQILHLRKKSLTLSQVSHWYWDTARFQRQKLKEKELSDGVYIDS